MKRRELIKEKVKEGREKVREEVKERVKDKVKDAIRAQVEDTIKSKVVGKAVDYVRPIAEDSMRDFIKRDDSLWSQRRSKADAPLVSIQVSIAVGANEKCLIDNILSNQKFKILKQLISIFSSKNKNDFYALLLERKMEEYLKANSTNKLVANISDKVISCLKDFYQQLDQRKQQQQQQQTRFDNNKRSHTSVETSITHAALNSVSNKDTNTSQITGILASTDVFYDGGIRLVDMSKQIEKFGTFDKTEVETVFNTHPEKIKSFLQRVTRDKNSAELLVKLLIKYKFDKLTIEYLARYDKTKKSVFDYIVNMNNTTGKLCVLSACIEPGCSINLFFKVKTGLIKWGEATNKLSQLKKLHEYLKGCVLLEPSKQHDYVQMSLNHNAKKEVVESGNHEAQVIAQQQRINTSENVDSNFVHEGLELAFNFMTENPGSTLLLLSFVIGGLYFYFHSANQEDDNVEQISMHP